MRTPYSLFCHSPHGPSEGIGRELRHHLPFSIGSVLVALLALGLLERIGQLKSVNQGLFHLLHPTHLLLSATATTAMFWLHDRKPFKAVLIGLLGTVPVCSAGDIVFPYLGGLLLGLPVTFHLCVIEEPLLVFTFAGVGIGLGIFSGEYVRRSTFYSHAAHVLVSSFASLLYLTTFGAAGGWMQHLAGVPLVLFFSVLAPCCFSDIIFPLLFVRHKGHGEWVLPPSGLAGDDPIPMMPAPAADTAAPPPGGPENGAADSAAHTHPHPGEPVKP